MLSTSPVTGPAAPQVTLNLQLRPTSSVTLTQLMQQINAAGATVQSTTIPGLTQVAGPSVDMPTLAQELSTNSAVQYAAAPQTLQIATVPNDPNYINGGQWDLNGTWGINAPTAWNTTTGSENVIVADVDTGMN